MGAEVVGVGSVEEQDLAVEEMKVESNSMVGKRKIVHMVVGRPADMFGFHGHILANFVQASFGLAKDTKYAKV